MYRKIANNVKCDLIESIREVSTYPKSSADKLGRGKIACVMDRDIDFGIAGAWERITQFDIDIEIDVFRELQDANGLKDSLCIF